MKKGLSLSLLFHCLLTLPLFLGTVDSKPIQVEITLEDPGNESDLKLGKNEEMNIKELGIGEGEEAKKYYWGLGMQGEFIGIGYRIKIIYNGYKAQEVGLQVGDIITSVDGSPMTEANDIKGDKPKKLSLTILRNSVIMNIIVERGKVYY